MMKIVTLKDLVQALKSIQKEDNIPVIQSSGLSKFKDQIFKITQHIDKGMSVEYSPQESELHKALSDFSKAERKSLMNTMLTSYFTPDYLTEAISESIGDYIDDRLTNPSILEPSSGTGNFIDTILKTDSLTALSPSISAIEKDLITSKILANNFSNETSVNVLNQGYEDFQSDQGFDIIIGNVPFGNYGIYDKSLHNDFHHLYSNRVHNYFFIKSSQQLKPGGIMALITTASMSDLSANQNFRRYLVENNNLISLIRLPNNTFKESSTAVVSDLIVLQRPLEPKNSVSEREEAFVNTGSYENQFSTNQFLLDNSMNIMGELARTTGIAGREVLTVKPFENRLGFQERKSTIKKILDHDYYLHGLKTLVDIPIEVEKAKEPEPNEAEMQHNEVVGKYPSAVPGNIIYNDKQNLFQKVGVHPEYFQYLNVSNFAVSQNDRERLFMMIEIRDVYKALLLAVRDNEHENIPKLQDSLNQKYDVFNFMHAEFHQKRNFALLKKEEERDLVLGLEIFENGVYRKADIFTKTLVVQEAEQNEIVSIDFAIIESLNNHGKIDLDFISDLMRKPVLEWAPEALLSEKLYLNPIIKDHKEVIAFELVSPSEFLSGFVESKLKIYKNGRFESAGALSPLFNKEIIDLASKALYPVLPLKLSIEEINPNLGENWVPIEIYQLFGIEHFEDEKFRVKFFPNLDRFKVAGGYNTKATAKYGVQKSWGSVSYHKVFQYAMEHNVPAFTKTVMIDGKERKVVDKQAVNSVKLSVDTLNKAFSEWLLTKKEFCASLESKYHFLYNAEVKQDYSSRNLKFDELQGFTPYNHQSECAIQIVQQNGGIIDHEVGFGKSLTMPMIAMTKKKFKLINKELVAGLNANYVDLYNTFRASYPKGRFLLVTPKDIAPEKKQQTFYKIANNDWDAVITAHSCLSKFPRAPYTEADIYDDMIAEVENTLDDPESLEVLSRREVAQLEKKLNTAKANFDSAQAAINAKKEDGLLIFEDLGFDSLTIDESQFFKNLTFSTKHTRVAGLGTTQETQKTTNLLSYVRSIQKIHEADKGITFASGTTISNSITELYHIFRYLRPRALADKGIHCFDQWARLYARKTTEYEESVGGDIKLKERFRYFVKAPELAKFYNDITHYADFNTFQIERPKAKTQFIAIEPYPEQLNYFKAIQEFAKTKDPKHLIGVGSGDNIKKAAGLICTSQGRKSSLDLRLIDPSFGDHPNNKINIMISKALEIYHRFEGEKGTQLIFCDQGTPTGKNFNLYQAIKENLMEQGVPEHEIEFIHSHDRNRKALYKRVNDGEVRFLIGSTSKMGVGVNVQKRMVAMHHLDFPWRPTDLNQRNGRGERTGNIVLPKYDNEIKVYYYGVKNSLDAYTFNILHIKDKFIKQLKSASLSNRVLDEGIIGNDGNVNLEDFQALCSPNQLLTQKLKIERSLNGLLDKRQAFQNNKRKNQGSLSFIKSDLESYEKTAKRLTEDHLKAKSILDKFDSDSNRFFLNINGKPFTEAKTAGKALRAHLKSFFSDKSFTKGLCLCKLDNGFQLELTPKIDDLPFDINNYKLLLKTPSNIKVGYKSHILPKDEKDSGWYALNCFMKIEDLVKSYDKKVNEAKEQKEMLEEIMSEEFEHSEEIENLKKEIEKLDKEIESQDKNLDGNKKGPKL